MSGRPSLGARKRAVHIASYLAVDEAEQLDRRRAELGLSRSDYVRALLLAALAQQAVQQS